MRLTEHFLLAEFVRVPASAVPTGVIENLSALCVRLLEPLREAMGLEVVIHSGWRPPAHNAAVGGVEGSDHETGRAADFHVAAGCDRSWEENTMEAYHWLRRHRLPYIGQLILEDHRIPLKDSGKLWVHASTPSAKHPGMGDGNQLLVSFDLDEKGKPIYQKFSDSIGGFA